MQQILCRPLHHPESQTIAHERSSSTSSKQRSRLSDSDEHLKDYVREQSHNVSPEVILDRVCMSFEDERSYLLREPITRDELGYELNNINPSINDNDTNDDRNRNSNSNSDGNKSSYATSNNYGSLENIRPTFMETYRQRSIRNVRRYDKIQYPVQLVRMNLMYMTATEYLNDSITWKAGGGGGKRGSGSDHESGFLETRGSRYIGNGRGSIVMTRNDNTPQIQLEPPSLYAEKSTSSNLVFDERNTIDSDNNNSEDIEEERLEFLMLQEDTMENQIRRWNRHAEFLECSIMSMEEYLARALLSEKEGQQFMRRRIEEQRFHVEREIRRYKEEIEQLRKRLEMPPLEGVDKGMQTYTVWNLFLLCYALPFHYYCFMLGHQ